MGSNTRASNNRINTDIPKLDPSKADTLHTYTFHCNGTTPPTSAVVALGAMTMIICSTQLRISVIMHDIDNNNNDAR